MAVSCYFLLLLALSPSLSMAALPNEGMMRESSRFLSDRFKQLRRNGLGVEHMKVCYIIIVIIYLPFSLCTCTLFACLFINWACTCTGLLRH